MVKLSGIYYAVLKDEDVKTIVTSPDAPQLRVSSKSRPADALLTDTTWVIEEDEIDVRKIWPTFCVELGRDYEKRIDVDKKVHRING